MRIIADATVLQDLTALLSQEQKSIGFVPTMGALHEGHLRLVKAAREQTEVVIASIFVNPTQFGKHEDLSRYPRNLERDKTLLEPLGVDYLFTPSPSDIYPEGYATYVNVEGLGEMLEGASRPGHFRGVATVLTILFNLVRPTRVFMGQKDAQQTIVVKKMVRDLRIPTEIIVLPTVREADGLALSSRNQYLNPQERQAATVLFRALTQAKQLYTHGERDAQTIIRAMLTLIAAEPLATLDYIAINDADTLVPLDDLSLCNVVISLAVRIGNTRLIDNFLLP
ncbi:MAG TPA: pantoate--beta-alanine ligase [Blastocatellia bacterium]|nr:pantoate--beta-alanine ligase [Blastocatellia bacterium]